MGMFRHRQSGELLHSLSMQDDAVYVLDPMGMCEVMYCGALIQAQTLDRRKRGMPPFCSKCLLRWQFRVLGRLPHVAFNPV